MISIGSKVATDPESTTSPAARAAMAGPGWIYVLRIAATLILSGGAICVLLFAM